MRCFWPSHIRTTIVDRLEFSSLRFSTFLARRKPVQEVSLAIDNEEPIRSLLTVAHRHNQTAVFQSFPRNMATARRPTTETQVRDVRWELLIRTQLATIPRHWRTIHKLGCLALRFGPFATTWLKEVDQTTAVLQRAILSLSGFAQPWSWVVMH
ncbi:hypothetical protein BDW60DRAFT_186067 [Aspergillus nidulans var. acristatus]